MQNAFSQEELCTLGLILKVRIFWTIFVILLFETLGT